MSEWDVDGILKSVLGRLSVEFRTTGPDNHNGAAPRFAAITQQTLPQHSKHIGEQDAPSTLRRITCLLFYPILESNKPKDPSYGFFSSLQNLASFCLDDCQQFHQSMNSRWYYNLVGTYIIIVDYWIRKTRVVKGLTDAERFVKQEDE